MNVTFFGTYDEERHPRVRVLRQGLAARGVAITVRNVPLGDSTEQRIEAAHRPLAGLRWIGRLVVVWGRLLFGRAGDGRPDAVVVGYLGVLDVLLARLRWPRAFIVLDHMAPLVGVAADRGLPRPAALVFRWLDRCAESVADLVMFDTADHSALSRCPESKKLVVPVGASYEWFSLGSIKPPDDALEVIFFGLHTPLQGTPTIGEAIGRLSESAIRFTMVGTGQDLDSCRSAAAGNPNVTWIRWVAGDELPALVARHQVCLGIFGDTPKAARVVPNKVYQAAAAGCAVITRSSQALQHALGSAAVYVDPGSGEGLAMALLRLAEDQESLHDLRLHAAERARTWTPERVTDGLYHRLSELC